MVLIPDGSVYHLLKTLAKLIDRHMLDDTLKLAPLDRNKFAYQTGKSCELAIYELASREGKTIGK